MIEAFTTLDLLAAGWFVLAWVGYALVVEATPLAHRTLNARMDAYRVVWMRRMARREIRIVDANIMGTLQNGSAFFASTSLIALGGALSFLRSPEEALRLFSALPFASPTSALAWEVKVMGLAVIFAYAFFKFAWSYRLMNYAAILIGATPDSLAEDEVDASEMAARAAAMNRLAGAHFNRGQRAFFFAVGYLGWFLGPALFAVATAGVLLVMARRQFGRTSLKTLEGKI
jgi:uncharacterized membrane protein